MSNDYSLTIGTIWFGLTLDLRDIGDEALLNAHINRILNDDIPRHTINNCEVIVDLNCGADWLIACFNCFCGAFRCTCPLARAGPITLKLQGLDHLQQTIATNIVDDLLLRTAAQIDATIVPRVLDVAAILLDLQSGRVANDLQAARIVDYAHTIPIADDA